MAHSVNDSTETVNGSINGAGNNQHPSASGKALDIITCAQYRLSCIVADKTRTTVPFRKTENFTHEAVIQAAQKRMAKQLKAFDEIFNKAEQVS